MECDDFLTRYYLLEPHRSPNSFQKPPFSVRSVGTATVVRGIGCVGQQRPWGGLPRVTFLTPLLRHHSAGPRVRDKNSGGFPRASKTSARTGIFPKTCAFVLTWVEAGGSLYFACCFIKPLRRPLLYKSYEYDSVGSFQKPLVLCKKTAKKTLEIIRVVMVRCAGQPQGRPLLLEETDPIKRTKLSGCLDFSAPSQASQIKE